MFARQPLSRISFRRQIMLLGILAAVLLVAVIFATFAALQYTRSAVLKDDQRHLAEITSSLAREYEDAARGAQRNHQPDILQTYDNQTSRDALTNLTVTVLKNADGVEGGFYDASSGVLLGFPSSVHSPSAQIAPTLAPSDDAHSNISEVARQAVESHAPAQRILTSGEEVTLIEAMPLKIGSQIVGSSWTTMHLSSVPGTNRFRTYLIAVALGLAAFGCVILTLLVVRGLQSGVRKIEGGLRSLELNLASEIPVEDDPDEIRQIAGAINRLGGTLREKIESEKQIEDRLHHAERLAALGRLVAGVAHEVRNPLATIRLRVQMCQQEVVNSDVKHSCAIALEEVERLNGMVNRLLSFSRPVQLQSEPIDLQRLLEQRLRNFAEVAKAHNVKLFPKLNRHSKPVKLDQSRIAQVFDNIIQNAIDSMRVAGGTLCVNVAIESKTSNSSEVCVEFHDTGEGIPSEVLNRIFDPFFTTKPSGTGLGLSICHELVQAHGGEINVTSAEGCGTTVRVVLPVVNEPQNRLGA